MNNTFLLRLTAALVAAVTVQHVACGQEALGEEKQDSSIVVETSAPHVADLDADALGAEASAMFRLHDYNAADKLFERYLSSLVPSAGGLFEELWQSDDCGRIGNRLYDYALNSFFSGNEEKGMEMLALSKTCGNTCAARMYDNLLLCPSMNPGIELKRKWVNMFENDIRLFHQKSDRCSPAEFWDRFVSENEKYQALESALNEKRVQKTLRKALLEINSSESRMNERLDSCKPLAPGYVESALAPYLVNSERAVRDFRVYPSDIPNAFATPYGDIYLTTSLVMCCEFSTELLAGICAHEMTHYLCRHTLDELWSTYRKERSNMIWGSIAAGLYVAGMSAAAITAAAYGVPYDGSFYNNVGQTGTQMFYAIVDASHFYQFKYSRSQEIEADLAAYHFCESIGIGGYTYIMALQLICDKEEKELKAKKSDTHPTTLYRIFLLKYLFNKEHSTD